MDGRQQPLGDESGDLDSNGDHEAIVVTIIREATGLLAPQPVARARPDDDLRVDLSYNSLALVELSFVLEDAFGLEEISREEARAIETVGHIEDYVLGKMRLRGHCFAGDDPAPALAVLEEVRSWGTLEASSAT